MRKDKHMDLEKKIWFRPPWSDGGGKEIVPVYLSPVGPQFKSHKSVCPIYYKDGVDMGEKDALEGRWSTARNEDLIDYTDELWEACQTYMQDKADARQAFGNRRKALKKGQVTML